MTPGDVLQGGKQTASTYSTCQHELTMMPDLHVRCAHCGMSKADVDKAKAADRIHEFQRTAGALTNGDS
jgi:hypothetical protein